MIITSENKSPNPSRQDFKEAGFIAIFLIAVILVLKVLVIGVCVRSFGKEELPSAADVIVDGIILLGVAMLGAAIRLAVPYFYGKSLARSVEATAERLVIHRFDGQDIHAVWEELTSVGLDPTDKSWEFRTKKREISLSSHGFASADWESLNATIMEHLPFGIEDIENLCASSSRQICRWIDTLTVPTITIGTLATAVAILLGYRAGAILVGSIPFTLVVIYVALYYQFGFRLYETPTSYFLGWLGFWGIKLLGLLPLCAIYFGIVHADPELQASPAEESLSPLSMMIFLGGLGLGMVFTGGLSYGQYKTEDFHGVNQHAKRISGLFFAVCIIGFCSAWRSPTVTILMILWLAIGLLLFITSKRKASQAVKKDDSPEILMSPILIATWPILLFGKAPLSTILFLFVGCVIYLGERVGGRFGHTIIGAVCGLCGVAASVGLLAIVIRLCARWRPPIPACYRCGLYPEALARRDWAEQESRLAEQHKGWVYRCQCGKTYLGTRKHKKTLEVLPDGTVRPYMKHKAFGRWIKD
ncbi:MAG: hypothetical protein ACYTEL_10525 [Planctomycetota bacterium]|jgi:hypothetical protein